MKAFLGIVVLVLVGCLFQAALSARDDRIRNLKIELATVNLALKRCKVECVKYEPVPMLEVE